MRSNGNPDKMMRGKTATKPNGNLDNQPAQHRGQWTSQQYATEFQRDNGDQTELLVLGEEDQDVLPISGDNVDKHIVGVIMTQYRLGTGLRRFRKRGEEAITAERGKLHKMEMFVPVHKEDMSEKEQKEVVESLMFLKEKRDQAVHGRMVADG